MSQGTPVTATASTFGPASSSPSFQSAFGPRRAIVRFGKTADLGGLPNEDDRNIFDVQRERQAAADAEAVDPLAGVKTNETAQVPTRKDTLIRQAAAAAAVRSGNQSDLLGTVGAKKRAATRALLGGE